MPTLSPPRPASNPASATTPRLLRSIVSNPTLTRWRLTTPLGDHYIVSLRAGFLWETVGPRLPGVASCRDRQQTFGAGIVRNLCRQCRITALVK